MRLAGPISAEERSVVGQAFLVARLTDRVRQRVQVERRRLARRLVSQAHAGHICENPGERRDLLIEMVRAALRNHRVTLLLHGMRSNGEMIRYLQGRRLPAEAVAKLGSFLLVPAANVWRSRPDPTEAIELVEELHGLAEKAGTSQVQIITDAYHRFLENEQADAVLAMEEWWNRARLDGVHMACLYRGADVAGPELRDRIGAAHETPREARADARRRRIVASRAGQACA